MLRVLTTELGGKRKKNGWFIILTILENIDKVVMWNKIRMGLKINVHIFYC